MVQTITYHKRAPYERKFFRVTKLEMNEEFIRKFSFLDRKFISIDAFRDGYLVSTGKAQYVIQRFKLDCKQMIEIEYSNEIIRFGDNMQVTQYAPGTYEVC